MDERMNGLGGTAFEDACLKGSEGTVKVRIPKSLCT